MVRWIVSNLCFLGLGLGWSTLALGRRETRSGEERLGSIEGVSSSDRYTKHYSKAERAQSMPVNPVKSWSETAAGEVTNFIKRVGSGLQGDGERRALDGLKYQTPDQLRWAQSHAILDADPLQPRPADVKAIQNFFANQGQRAASDTVRDRVPTFANLSSVKFNFDLWGAGSGASEEAPSGVMKYGLIVEDIEPVGAGLVPQGANSSLDSRLSSTSKAKVRWSIGPLPERQRPIFRGSSVDPGPKGRRIGGLRIPSSKFRGSAQPESMGGLGSPDQMSAWRFELAQEEDLYQLTMRTRPGQGRSGMEHTVKVPVAGTLSFGRRFSDDLSTLETSASGVLLDKRLPQVIVRYLHIEERYRAEVQSTVFGHSVGASARSKVRGKTDRPDEANEAYSLTYSRNL